MFACPHGVDILTPCVVFKGKSHCKTRHVTERRAVYVDHALVSLCMSYGLVLTNLSKGGHRPRYVCRVSSSSVGQRMFSPSGLRLADKRSLPCPKRNEWLAARDDLYEEIMHKAWNPTLQAFGQSYEATDVLDSSVLIMPLVFFMTPVSGRACSFDQGSRVACCIAYSPIRGL